MFTEEEVLRLVNSLIDKVKKNNPPRNSMRRESVAYYDSYTYSCTYAEKVKNHAEVGCFPEKLFFSKAPNMTEIEYKYLKDNFKQTTLPVWLDYISTISTAFQDGNWNINYKGDDNIYEISEETFQKYVEKGIDKYGSLENFMKFVLPQIKGVDSNGIVAVRPDYIPVLPDSDDVDTAVLLEPQIYYYRCDQVVSRKHGEYYLVLLDERVNVKYGNVIQKVGYSFELYDQKNIWKIFQVGEYTDMKFQAVSLLEHNEGVCPAHELMGVPKIINNELVWMPQFIYAVDNLDLALMNAQYLQVSVSFACFPYLVMVGDDCDYEFYDGVTSELIRCRDGLMEMPDQTKRTCPKCNGSGMKDRTTPFGRLLLKKGEGWKGDGDKAFADRAMYYVSPDTTALEFVNEKIESDTAKSRNILHLQRSNSIVKGSENQTATGQSLDQKSKIAFVKPISDQMFHIYQFLLDRIGWQRYNEKYKAPELTFPVTFDYNTEDDYMLRITEAQKAGFPPMIIETIFMRYLQTLYYNEKETTEVFKLIVECDRILCLSQEDINIKMTRGLIEKWEVILHDSSIALVNELVSNDNKFFAQDFNKQKDDLIQLAKSKTASINPSTTQNLVTDILA